MTEDEILKASFTGLSVFFLVQILLLWRDGKRNQQNAVEFSLLKLFPFLLLLLGFEAFAFPWVYVPGEGGRRFLRLILAARGPAIGEKIIIPGAVLYLSYWLMAGATIFQLVFRISVKSKLTLLLEVMLGLGSTCLGILLIRRIPVAYSKLDPIWYGHKVEVTIGFDLYLATVIGILYAAFVLLMNYNTLKKIRQSEL